MNSKYKGGEEPVYQWYDSAPINRIEGGKYSIDNETEGRKFELVIVNEGMNTFFLLLHLSIDKGRRISF